MKLATIPDNLAERIALWTGMLPPGVFESWFGAVSHWRRTLDYNNC